VLLLTFVGLQVLDAFTTVVFLNMGVKEGNPLMRLALEQGDHAGMVLAAAKLFAIALAVFAWRSGRRKLLLKLDLLFALVVVWNLIAIGIRL
jgi:hypothetical protein